MVSDSLPKEESYGRAYFTEDDKRKLLKISEISLWIDSYDDIFSDFDPRPYSERGLSEDFIFELKKASKFKTSGRMEVRLLVPRDKRNRAEETLIAERLKHHFSKHHRELEKEAKEVFRKGASFVLVGIILMMIATMTGFYTSEKTLITSFLVILFEPAGWFFFWEGLTKITEDSGKMKPEQEFCKKLSECEIIFLDY